MERNDKKALSHYFRVLKEIPVNSRYYAMAAFAIANNYSANHQPEKYEEYIVQACISDLKNCTRENLALQDFAMYLYQKDNENVSRAERYINFAMDDAKAYNNRLRIIEISQKLPIIVKNYREKLTAQNNLMRAALWGISILLIIMLVLSTSIDNKTSCCTSIVSNYLTATRNYQASTMHSTCSTHA